MNKQTLALLLCTVSVGAFAQAPAAPAAATDAPLAKHSCAKPALPDANKKLTTVEKNAFVASMEKFRTCVREFSDGQEKIKAAKESEAKSLQESSQAALKSAQSAKAAVDGATTDYNTFSADAVKILNKDAAAPAPAASKGTAEPAPPRPVKYY